MRDPLFLMLRCTMIILCTAAAFGASAQLRPAAPDPAHALEGAALVKALRAGGLTLYFRHVATDMTQSDRVVVAGECATQRNLTDAGRAQARAAGEAMRRLALPVGEVLASPYCRTMETAALLTGKEPVAEPVVRGRAGATGSIDYAPLGVLLAQPVAPGTLRVVSGHGNGFRSVAGEPHLAEGEAAVLKPEGSRFVVVARLAIDDWAKLPAP